MIPIAVCLFVAVELLGISVAVSAHGLRGLEPARTSNADLYVARDNLADVYLNGQLLSSTYYVWDQMKYSIAVKPGDAIVVVARDTGVIYGATAALISTGKSCVTRAGAGPWRAIKRGKLVDPTFKEKSFDASSWPFPTVASVEPPGLETSSSLAYETKGSANVGSEYVWVEDAGVNSRVVLRLDVTDKCV